MFSDELQAGKITKWPNPKYPISKDEEGFYLRRVNYELTRKGASAWVFTDGTRPKWDYISPRYRLGAAARLTRMIPFHKDNGWLVVPSQYVRGQGRLPSITEYAKTLMEQAKHNSYPTEPYYDGMVWKPSLLIFDEVDQWVKDYNMVYALYQWLARRADYMGFAVLSIDRGG